LLLFDIFGHVFWVWLANLGGNGCRYL